MSLSIEEYFSRKGAVELLCEIDPHGSQFNELASEMFISRPTLTDRLDEGIELSLFDSEAGSGNHGRTHMYVLAPKGATIRRLLEENGVVITYEQLKTLRQQFERTSSEFLEEMAENDDIVEDHIQNQRNLAYIKGHINHDDTDQDED